MYPGVSYGLQPVSRLIALKAVIRRTAASTTLDRTNLWKNRCANTRENLFITGPMQRDKNPLHVSDQILEFVTQGFNFFGRRQG
jgi:hypothetical protein